LINVDSKDLGPENPGVITFAFVALSDGVPEIA
jgi:hypothetical protein